MKRTIKSSDAIEELDPVSCVTVGELIAALQKFPKDTRLASKIDWRRFTSCSVEIDVVSGNRGEKFVTVDSVDLGY